MKETRRQGTNNLNSLWKNLTSGIKIKVKKNDNLTENNEARDMGDAHTPLSRLDLTGLNREQAKDAISKIIDERLMEISHIEMTEFKIDPQERERQKAEAAERSSERRSRRKHRHSHRHETAFLELQTEASIEEPKTENVIEVQPQAIIEELKDKPEGSQLPISEIKATGGETEVKPLGFDFFGLLQYDPDREGITEEQADKMAGVKISTAIDEAVDKVFAGFEKKREIVLRFYRRIKGKCEELFIVKINPAASRCKDKVSRKAAPMIEKAESRLRLREKTAAALAALRKTEKKISESAAAFTGILGRKSKALLFTLLLTWDKVRHHADLIRDYAENHKKKILIEFAVTVAVTAMITIMIGNLTAYEYIYNGKVLGVAKNQEDVYKTIDIIGDKLSTQYDADITIDKEKDIRFKKVIAFNQDIDSKDDILNRLTYMRDMKAKGHGIYINGSLAAILESDVTAKAILNEIQSKYVKKDANIEYKKIGFAENVEIKGIETKLGNIQAKDKVLEYMLTGAVEERIHVVQSGETFSGIAKMYSIKQSELKASNPDVNPEKLSIGQEISLNQIVPLVTVQTTEVAKYKEAIPFEIKYENTANLFKKEQTVKSKGVNGEKDVVAEIVRNNGIEVSRNELCASVLSQPVAQVVLVGTKDPPPLIGTGSFIYPIRGTLTSRFGSRWGRLHSGIDLAAPIGTHIKASDGGKVTFAGYNGALGYMIAIDHGGGRTTWYGHCIKLFVKKGDRVYQGQHIANVGNTGRSTGPHCHFEVHINGVAKNPLKYL